MSTVPAGPDRSSLGSAARLPRGARAPRVLMLGWEFPPHISGGLGTACLGITRGLARSGVDVLFVVPRVFGDEESAHLNLLGCDGVSRAAAGRGHAAARDTRTALPVTGAAARARIRTIAVESSLHPYLGAAAHRERTRRLRKAQPTAPGAPAGPSQQGPARDERPELLRCSGSYGPDLFREVARYREAVVEIAGRYDFDVVHAHDWMTYPAGMAAARVSGRPLVAHVHAAERDRCGDGADARIEGIERAGTNSADIVVCVSRYTADLVRRRYGVGPHKLRVVHNALLDVGRSVETARSISEPIVLFLGRVTCQKGPEYFLRAAARVAEALPEAKFVVAGGGDMLAPMVELSAELGIARNVHFTGFLQGADVARMYAMADVYVMPSVSEPFGITALEAAALGVPVIVSKSTGVSEVLGSVLKSDFWDTDDLADKIFALLQRACLHDELAANAREESRASHWEDRGAELRGIYEELVP